MSYCAHCIMTFSIAPLSHDAASYFCSRILTILEIWYGTKAKTCVQNIAHYLTINPSHPSFIQAGRLLLGAYAYSNTHLGRLKIRTLCGTAKIFQILSRHTNESFNRKASMCIMTFCFDMDNFHLSSEETQFSI